MNFAVLVSFTVCVVGSITIAVLLIKNRSLPARLLAVFLFANTYSVFLMWLYDSGYILKLPHFFRTAPLVAYISAPAFYLYISFSLDRTKKLSWKYSLHLLGAIIYLIDYFPLLMKSADYKKAIASKFVSHPEAILSYREGWLLPNDFHYAAWVFFSLAYVFPAVALLFRQYNKGLSTSLTKNNMFPWLITLTAINAIFISICVLIVVFTNKHPMWYIEVVNSGVTVFIISTILSFWPHVLYDGIYIYNSPGPESRKIKQKPVKIPEKAAEQFERLLQNFSSQNLLLNNNCSLKTVADELQVQSYILSAYINQVYQMHFNDLVNKYRIDYIKQELLGRERDLLTLEAIAEKAGYNNRTTFLSAFKKFTGMTPTAFIKQSRKTSEQDQLHRKISS